MSSTLFGIYSRFDMTGCVSALYRWQSYPLHNVRIRTFLVGALLSAILLAGIFGPLDAPVSSADQMQVSNIPGGPTGDPTIDLSHGAVQTNFSLGGTLDNSSPAYNLKASYSSNVKGAIKTWIQDYQASELGLGWSIEHPRIIRMNQGTGWRGDDRFVYYAAGHGMQELKYLSAAGDLETYAFRDAYQPTTKIQRFVGNDDSYWIVTMPNGVKYYYGGKWGSEDPSNYSDDFKQVCAHLQHTQTPAAGRCQSAAIEYGVQWGNWVGVSQNPKNQTNIEVAWNLSRIESVTGQVTTLSYINDIQDVGRQLGNLKPKAFSRSAYLYRVQQESGAKTVVAYCAMADASSGAGPSLEDEAQPAHYDLVDTGTDVEYYSNICKSFRHLGYGEFVDPHTESTEPDGYQERLTTLFIGGAVSFAAHSDVPSLQTQMSYDFLSATSDDMAKRILTGVTRDTFSEAQSVMKSTSPPTLFRYWGQEEDDGVSVTKTDFSRIYNAQTKALYGAIKSITSSTGMTKTYTYQKQSLNIARHLLLRSQIKTARTALFSDGYILLVGADFNDNFTLELVEWTPSGWAITYAHHAGPFPHGKYNPYKLITMQPRFFAFTTTDFAHFQVVSKHATSRWANSSLIDVDQVRSVQLRSTSKARLIQLRSTNDSIFFSYELALGDNKSNYILSKYSATDERITEGIIHAGNESGSYAAMAISEGQVGFIIAKRDATLSGYVAFYDLKSDTWSKLPSTGSHPRWCLPNNQETSIDRYCNYFGSPYADVNATFVDNLLSVRLHPLDFSGHGSINGKAQYGDVGGLFVLGGDDAIVGVEGKCLNGTTDHSVKVLIVRECNGQHNQHWIYDELGHKTISREDDGQCVTEGDTAVIVTDCDGDNSKQRWDYDDTRKTFAGASGKCLAVNNQWFVHSYECSDSENQKWTIPENYRLIAPDVYKFPGPTKKLTGTGIEVGIPPDNDYPEAMKYMPYLKYEEGGKAYNLDPDLETAGVFYPGQYWKTDGHHRTVGLASSLSLYWHGEYHKESNLSTFHPDHPTKYNTSTEFLTAGAGQFSSAFYWAHKILAKVQLDDRFNYSDVYHQYDVLSARCNYRAFDGSEFVDMPLYYNPKHATGALVDFPHVPDFSDRLSPHIYINANGAQPPDLGCVGAVFMSDGELTTYNSVGKREFYALYPRLRNDGNSVLIRSLGHIQGLAAQLSKEEIERYHAITAAKAKLKEIVAEAKGQAILNYVLAAESGIADIITFNFVGLGLNILMTAEFTYLSKEMEKESNHEQQTIRHAVKKLTTTDPSANLNGSRYSLYNTALIYKESNGTISFVSDIQDDISHDGVPVEARFIKKFDPESGVATFQSNFGPYLRTFVNGTTGTGNLVAVKNNMTAGEKNDLNSLGYGRNFVTYEKGAESRKYTCWKSDEERLTRDPVTDEYDDPCFFGAQGEVAVHRVLDEAGVGNLDSIVVDTVTVNDGLQATKVSYDFEAATAGHSQEAVNYNKVSIFPGGRGSGNGHIEQLMYNGVESEISIACEVLDAEAGTYTACPDDNGLGQVDSRIYPDQLRGLVYQRSVYENGKTEPQGVTQTQHKVQTIKRSNFRDVARVLPVRMDNTRDDVTTVTLYEYNAYGQKTQTSVAANRFVHATGKIINEGTSASALYTWETDAYGDAFKAANRYADIAQTTSFRLEPNDSPSAALEDDDDSTKYSIVGIDGKCLDVHGDIESGSDVQLYECSGSSKQEWTYNVDTKEIKSGDFCLDVKGASANNGANIQIYHCNGGDNQKWYPYADQKVPGETQGIGGKCVDVRHGETDDGTTIQLYDCNDGGNQKWAFLSADVAQPIVNRLDGKCLTSDGEFHNGVNVVVKECTTSSRKWVYEPGEHGRIKSEPVGKCLDIHNKHDNSSNVQMWDCNGGDLQEWSYHADTGEIKSGGYCLDVDEGDGTNVQIYGCAGGSNQRWEWTALPRSLTPLPIPGFPLTESWVPHLLGSKAQAYVPINIDGLDAPVYLPKRSYVYRTDTDEDKTPVFDPSNPDSNWMAMGETTTYDAATGTPTVITNVQTNRVNSLLLTQTKPKIAYATFGNVNVQTFEASYTGFETYEDQKQAGNFTLENGSINDNGYSGGTSYGADTGAVRVTVKSYNVPSGRLALLSAWVSPSDGQTCQLGIGEKTAASQSGNGQTWQYLEVSAAAGAEASVSCGHGGYIDEVLIRPVDSTFGAKAHDAQYRITDTTTTNGVVTHLVRDQRNRLLGSYQHSPEGKARLLGFPIAGFSRYDGYGVKLNESVRDDFTQDQPNHSATIVFRDDTQSWFLESLSDGQSHDLAASRRFALRALVDVNESKIEIEVGSSGPTQLSLVSDTDESTSKTRLTLSQGNVSKQSDEIPSSTTDRVLTWVVIDQFSALFLDGKMVISTNALTSLSDSGLAPITFKDGTYSNFFIGQDPVFARSFHDGAGRTIQAQSLRLDAQDKPTQVKISQVLYDGWGKPSVQTKLTELDQSLGDYDTGFVTGFDWDTDTISGDIKTAFDKGHPFTRTRYADSPLLRPSVQALLPGDEFDIASTRAEKFGYGSIQDAADNGLLGRHDLYQVQNFLPYTDEIMMESTVVTDKAGRTVSTKHGHKDHGGYIEWKYQYDYATDNAFRTTIAFMPNYNAATVAGHDEFKNIATSWDNRGTVKTSQEPDLSGYALAVKDNLGRPRFMRKNVSDLSGNVNGVSYMSYDRKGRVSEVGVLKNVSKTVAEYRALADDPTFPISGQTCWQKRYLYDTDLQTGNKQKFLTGRVYGLVGNMNLIVDSPTDFCFDGDDKGKSYIFYKYDQRGRTIAISEVTNQTVRNSAYQYNNLRARLAVTYPTMEKMTSDDQSTGFEDLSQSRKRELLFNSDGQTTVHYPRNPLGQLSAVCDTADCSVTKYASQYRYDVYGKIVSNRLNDETLMQTKIYDFQERLIKLETTDRGGTVVFSEEMSYDPYQSGNIAKAIYNGTILDGQQHSYHYTYDIWGRLTGAKQYEGGGLLTRSHKYEYTYDHNGNVLSRKIFGATDQEVIEDNAYGYKSGKNQLASITDSVSGDVRHFTHNDYGAITSFTNKSGKTNQYTLDTRNDRVYRVINEDYEAEYAYDPLDRRITNLSASPGLFYGHNSLNTLIDEDTMIVPLPGGTRVEIRDGQTTYVVTDHLQSARVAIGSDSRVSGQITYTPFGESQATGKANLARLYTGMSFESETGTYDYHARWYDPSVGRFTSVDTARQSISSYSYTDNNPINKVDPNGLGTFSFLLYSVYGVDEPDHTGRTSLKYKVDDIRSKLGKLDLSLRVSQLERPPKTVISGTDQVKHLIISTHSRVEEIGVWDHDDKMWLPYSPEEFADYLRERIALETEAPGLRKDIESIFFDACDLPCHKRTPMSDKELPSFIDRFIVKAKDIFPNLTKVIASPYSGHAKIDSENENTMTITISKPDDEEEDLMMQFKVNTKEFYTDNIPLDLFSKPSSNSGRITAVGTRIVGDGRYRLYRESADIDDFIKTNEFNEPLFLEFNVRTPSSD